MLAHACSCARATEVFVKRGGLPWLEIKIGYYYCDCIVGLVTCETVIYLFIKGIAIASV